MTANANISQLRDALGSRRRHLRALAGIGICRCTFAFIVLTSNTVAALDLELAQSEVKEILQKHANSHFSRFSYRAAFRVDEALEQSLLTDEVLHQYPEYRESPTVSATIVRLRHGSLWRDEQWFNLSEKSK